MKNRFNKGFEETKQNKVPKYGIRKLKVGVVSCLLAFSMFAPVVGAHAENGVAKGEDKPTPAHVNLNTDDKPKADKLYEDVSKNLTNIAENIAKELEGIQQLEANIDKANADAVAAQKDEEDAKKDLAKKKADYEVKKKEFADAQANLKQRKTEFKAAEKAKDKADKYLKKEQEAYNQAKADYDIADSKAKPEEDQAVKDAQRELTAKQDALAKLNNDNAKYTKYKEGNKKVSQPSDLANDDEYVIEELKKDNRVTSAITTAKENIKYDSSTRCESVKKLVEKLNTDYGAFKTKNNTDNSALECDNSNGHAKWKTGVTSKAEGDVVLKKDIDNLNTAVDTERVAVKFERDDINEIKTAKETALADVGGGPKKKVYDSIPAKKEDTTTKEKEVKDAEGKLSKAQHVLDARKTKQDSAEKKLDKAEQKLDAAQEASDKANDAYETANDNKDAAQTKFDLAKAGKEDARTALTNAHTTLAKKHEAFRSAKENLRVTRKGCTIGYDKLTDVTLPILKGDDQLTDAEHKGIQGLRDAIAKELKDAEKDYSKVEQVVKSRESKIKLLQDLIASIKKFAATAGDTDATEAFDARIDKYNEDIDKYTDEVADYKEKLAECTALITTIRQLAEKAKVLKPRNLTPEGWNREGNDWTYTNSYGMTVKDDWVQGKNGDWFYLDGFGKMAHDKWVEVNKKWFYAGSNGVIAQEQWIQNKLGDWFYVKKGGYMAQNEWVQVKGQWYYAQKDGNMAKNVTLNINGVNYSFNANCAWVK